MQEETVPIVVIRPAVVVVQVRSVATASQQPKLQAQAVLAFHHP
jgi:hypothetical protein